MRVTSHALQPAVAPNASTSASTPCITFSPNSICSTNPSPSPLESSLRCAVNASTTAATSTYFEHTRLSIQSATQHVSEVVAYRLIFLDSNSVLYGSLYMHDVENSRITPALRILNQNLTLLSVIVADRVQPLAIKEVMKAAFEAYLMVLLAGGSYRVFTRVDHWMIEEDFDNLKKVFTCGEGLISEETVEKEGDTVEGVVALMG